MLSNVFSPSHPSAKAVMVIPSWQADKYSSRCVVNFFTATALVLPSSINWSILELRIFTMANSETTKNAVKAIKMATITKLNMSK